MDDSNDRWQPPAPGTDSSDEPTLGGGQPGSPEAEDAPVGIRIGRNPGNLGDDVADTGDISFPETNPAPAQI